MSPEYRLKILYNKLFNYDKSNIFSIGILIILLEYLFNLKYIA